ncbi:MAG: cytochrome c-type biogenesis protein [Pseudomonadota bacterium]
MRSLLLALLMLLCLPLQAQVTDRRPLQFQSEVEERRFRALTDELRCVMCQNQSLADSDAQIAVDLRREILQMIRDRRSDAEIREFLVARYGEFVLYRPGISAATLLLWFGPLLVLAGGGWILWRVARSRPRDAAPPADDTGDW